MNYLMRAGAFTLIQSVAARAVGLVVLAVLLLSSPALHAEGSKELAANGGNRAYLLSTTTANSSYPFPTIGTMKVYAKAGETIFTGSSAQAIGSGTINLRAPNGATYISGAGAAGFIANRSQELAGPLPNAGGYTPFAVPVNANQEGIWEIDFVSPSNGVDQGFNPQALAASANWAQPFNRYIAAFDVSVRNSAGTGFVSGRVFTNILSGILGTFNVGFNAVLHIVTKDGYQYTFDNNGQAGNGFSFFVNNKGFRNANGTPAYQSVNTTTDPDVQDPRSPDSQNDITHKIFFNVPSADLPAKANTVGGGNTWLISVPITAAISDVMFTGTTGSVGRAGVDPKGGSINFKATANGNYNIRIDIDQNGIYTDAIDRLLNGSVLVGDNAVPWDGIDGKGNAAPVRETAYNISISVSLFSAEVHFPFFDVERNINGILLTRINGPSSPDNTVYWDDSQITPVGTPSNPLQNLTGISSLVNGHKWGSPGGANDENDFGNIRSIDTWAYVTSPTLESNTSFRIAEADAGLTIPIPNVMTPNGDGRNDFFEINEIALYPNSRLVIINRWGNEVYRSENYRNTWNGDGLSQGTYYYVLDLMTSSGKRISYKGWLYLKK